MRSATRRCNAATCTVRSHGTNNTFRSARHGKRRLSAADPASAAEAFLRAGRIDDAFALVKQAIAVAEFAKAPHRLALARRVHGQILVTQNDREGALRAFDDAIASFTTLGSGLELARAVYHRAALRLARGDPQDREAALADAARARDAFAQMGAAHDRALTEQLLKEGR